MATHKDHNDDKVMKETLAAFYGGKLKPVKNSRKTIQNLETSARQYLRKDYRLNIRLSRPDVELLKRRAAEEGMPYQTLIASVLHKFVMGRLSQV